MSFFYNINQEAERVEKGLLASGASISEHNGYYKCLMHVPNVIKTVLELPPLLSDHETNQALLRQKMRLMRIISGMKEYKQSTDEGFQRGWINACDFLENEAFTIPATPMTSGRLDEIKADVVRLKAFVARMVKGEGNEKRANFKNLVSEAIEDVRNTERKLKQLFFSDDMVQLVVPYTKNKNENTVFLGYFYMKTA